MKIQWNDFKNLFGGSCAVNHTHTHTHTQHTHTPSQMQNGGAPFITKSTARDWGGEAVVVYIM